MDTTKITIAFTLILALAVVGCSDDDTPTDPGDENGNSQPCPIVPASWEGEWDYSNINVDCETQEVLSEFNVMVRFCAGEPFVMDVPLEGFVFECSGTVTDAVLHMESTSSYEESEGCTISSTSVVDATLSGDTMTGIATYNTTYSSGCTQQDFCGREEFSAVRRTGDSNCGKALVDSYPWGTVKSIY